MILRPHHILCMNFFTGKGYSENFVENMESVINILRETPQCDVTLSCSEDCICSHCPNNTDGLCSSDDKIQQYDKAIMELCELKPGKTYVFEYLLRAVNEKIINKNLIHAVCEDCTWYDLCSSNSGG